VVTAVQNGAGTVTDNSTARYFDILLLTNNLAKTQSDTGTGYTVSNFSGSAATIDFTKSSTELVTKVTTTGISSGYPRITASAFSPVIPNSTTVYVAG
jgi:hypothetical protein